MANKFPLVFDSTGKSLQELPTGDNLDLTGSSVLNAIDITATGTLTANTVSAQNINVDGGALAEVAKTNDYNDLSNKPTLFSGDYNDLTNKPTSISSDWANITNKPVIATKLSQLTNDTNFVSNSQINIIPSQVTGLSNVATSGSFNDLLNVPDYITREEAAGGTLTVELKNTGDLIGSVFGTDSSLIVDHLTSTINAETVNTNILTANILQSEDYNHQATGNVNITTSQYLNLRSTSFRLVNTLSGTEIYDVDAITFRGDVDFRFANVTGLILDQVVGNLTGSVFADDSSIMIDGISREVFASSVDTNNLATDTITAASLTNSLGGTPLAISGGTAGITISPGGVLNIPNATNITINATNTIDIEASGDLTLTSASGVVDFPSGTAVDFTGATVTGLNVTGVTGDLTGSVFGDDSTVLVDGVNNAIRGDSIEVGGGFYKIQVDADVASIKNTSGSEAGITINNVTGTQVGGAGGVTLFGNDGSALSIGTTAGSGSITIGNGSNTVQFTANTTLDLSDLTSINFSNSAITGFAGNAAYTADDATNWEGTPPTTVADAIDRLVAWITDFKNNDSTDPNRPAP